MKFRFVILTILIIFCTACAKEPMTFIDYNSLKFTAPIPLQQQDFVNQTSSSNILPEFSEKDSIYNSDVILLARVTKSKIINIASSDSPADYRIQYTIVPNQVLFDSSNVLKKDASFIIESLLPEGRYKDVDSSMIIKYSNPTTELLTNRTYLILAKKSNDSTNFNLTNPYYPAIEVTENGEYIFISGWKSLVDNSRVIKIEGEISKYRYRNDNHFLNDFLKLIKRIKKD